MAMVSALSIPCSTLGWSSAPDAGSIDPTVSTADCGSDHGSSPVPSQRCPLGRTEGCPRTTTTGLLASILAAPRGPIVSMPCPPAPARDEIKASAGARFGAGYGRPRFGAGPPGHRARSARVGRLRGDRLLLRLPRGLGRLVRLGLLLRRTLRLERRQVRRRLGDLRPRLVRGERQHFPTGCLARALRAASLESSAYLNASSPKGAKDHARTDSPRTAG